MRVKGMNFHQGNTEINHKGEECLFEAIVCQEGFCNECEIPKGRELRKESESMVSTNGRGRPIYGSAWDLTPKKSPTCYKCGRTGKLQARQFGGGYECIDGCSSEAKPEQTT